MLDIVGKRYIYLAFSAIIIIVGLISIAIPPSFRVGIDFTGGSTLTVRFKAPVDQARIRETLASQGQADAIISRLGDKAYFIQTRHLKDPTRDAQGNVADPGEKDKLVTALRTLGAIDGTPEFSSVSPVVSAETVRNATLAVLAACVGIMIYIWYAFRKAGRGFRYGVCALVALLHDVLVSLGMYSIFGKTIGSEVNSIFIVALLTVVGFSIHDTIVVFDRIRENLAKGISKDFEQVVNYSVLVTMTRSISTSMTLLFTVTALLLFGGSTLRDFMLILLVGVIAGTYSSIFVASQLMIIWEKGEISAFFRRRRGGSAQGQVA